MLMLRWRVLRVSHDPRMPDSRLEQEMLHVLDRVDQAFCSKDALRIDDVNERADSDLVLLSPCFGSDREDRRGLARRALVGGRYLLPIGA